MTSLSFRNSKIVYYGPHPCENCGINICKAGSEYGGSSFTYPTTPIYPNTEWQPHFCNPSDVHKRLGREAKETILLSWGCINAGAVAVGQLGYIILEDYRNPLSMVLSANQTFNHDVWGAWRSAYDRRINHWPTWKLSDKEAALVAPYLVRELEDPDTINVPQ